MANEIIQNIKQNVTIADGDTGEIFIDVPIDKRLSLRGYGYSFVDGTTYKLDTGNLEFPSRTDQEGSVAVPQIWGVPFPVRSGGRLRLGITNNTGSSQTYTVVFIVITDSLVNIASSGNINGNVTPVGNPDGSLIAAGGLIPPKASQTPILKFLTTVGTTAETIHTVTTGKTFYATWWFLSGSNDIEFSLYDTDGTTVIAFLDLGSPGGGNPKTHGYPLGMKEYPSGTDIKVSSNAAGNKITLMGWEE